MYGCVYQLFSFFSFRPDTNDSLLHTAIRNCQNIEQLKRFISTYDEEYILSMCRTVNNNGELPCDLIDKSILSQDDRIALKIILTNLIRNDNPSRISTRLELGDVLDNLSISVNDELLRLLRVVCQAVNETHEIIRESSTHPEANTFSPSKREVIRAKIKHNKAKIELEVLQFINSRVSAGNVNLSDLKQIRLNSLDLMREKAIEAAYRTGLGNCEDFSLVAEKILKERYDIYSSEIYCIKNGGHVFLVINRNKETNPTNFLTWNSNTIICDVQLGRVFDVRQIPSKLMDWRPCEIQGENSHINLLTGFNPNYHSLEPYAPELKEENNLTAQIFYWGIITLAGLLLFGIAYVIYYNHGEVDAVIPSQDLKV